MLALMRHGPAEDQSKSGRDDERQLSPEGRALVAEAARRLSSIAVMLGAARSWRVATSPLVRAHQTAHIMGEVLSGSGCAIRLEVSHPLALGSAAASAPPSSWAWLDELVRPALSRDTAVLLVGHHPSIEVAASSLVASASPLPSGGMRTATIVVLRSVASTSAPDTRPVRDDAPSSPGQPASGRPPWALHAIVDPRRPAPPLLG